VCKGYFPEPVYRLRNDRAALAGLLLSLRLLRRLDGFALAGASGSQERNLSMCKRWLILVPALLVLLFAAVAQPAAAAPSGSALQSPAPHFLKTTSKVVSKAACFEDAFTYCALNGRFQITATFDTPAGQSGDAELVRLSDDTAYMWFFSSANVEAVVKMLDACTFSNTFWFFAGGLTNVHVVITVTDTVAGVFNTYTNTQNTPFQPIQDTNAFDCP
jgi:hypothetical protein